MDYSKIVEQINSNQKRKCFKKPEYTEIIYLERLNLSEEVLDFYRNYNPIETIEINSIRLLPISEIIEENTNYTPGFILNPLGFCVIASTIEGDVYCIRNTLNAYSINIASHDEIYEGLENEEILKGTKEIARNLFYFFKYFIEEKLVASFYDLEE